MKRGILKYLPDKWFKTKKPRIVTEFTHSNGNIIGRGIGLFTDYNNISKEEYINGLINLSKIKSDKDKFLVLDKLQLLNYEDIEYIEGKTGLEVIDGKDVKVYFLTYVLKKIYSLLNEELTKKEILIISDRSPRTFELIYKLSKEVRFLTVIGENEEKVKQISEKIYNNTGLSIFFAKNIDKILTNYNIIINLRDEILLDLKNLRSKPIVFDISLEKNLSNELKKLNDSIVAIQDFLFNYDHLLMESNLFEIKGEIPSYKYGVFNDFHIEDFKKVLVYNTAFTIEDLINYKISYRIPIKGLDNKK